MTTALVPQPPAALASFGEMSVQTIIDRKRKIAEVMDAIMKEGEHYGKIPGCGDKPSLFKSGAEVLATTFQLAPTFAIERLDLPNNHREYSVVCTLKHIATGAVLGEGVGTCTTMESKYRWRTGQRKCPNCGKAAIRRSAEQYGGGWYCNEKAGGCNAKWKRGAKEIEDQNTDRIENPDVADCYNTVLKIGVKRAMVAAILTAVGASDILAQDLEDLPPGTPEYHDPADDDLEVRTARGTVDPQAEEVAAVIMADLAECRSPDDVKKLAPRINALPKGTRARYTAYEAYQKRMIDVDPDQTKTKPTTGDPVKDRIAARTATVTDQESKP